MTMVRLYLDTQLDTGKEISLQEHQVHYLRNVLRCRVGDQLHLFNAHSGEWLAKLEGLTKSQGSVVVLEQIRPVTAEPDVDLLFAPLKQEATHYMIEKATELGVARLLPVTTEFVQVHKINLEKLNRYGVDAAQQCERLSVPEVLPLRPLQGVLQAWNSNKLLIVCLERQDSVPLVQLLQGLDRSQQLAFLIGPEGGLSGKDIKTLTAYPFVRFCKMGPRILRAETAAAAALACYQSLRGDWQ
ncbi:16S rRNA (uracil(1498)-N(3))-methyltransferase [Candidatus Paracaedibacter symbiosus]|uniref:16S rRNA (uracil(1498)-N(3))-methyltransferase n=1 Tax=Candidatus Paracaedibacter symbiosus TaxID=244582 RepID=UPI000689F242|nr:16S rRNA (uracil(1498)-N(3))-methyltransferase [Candidatus Paracaedibacter symbiosus]